MFKYPLLKRVFHIDSSCFTPFVDRPRSLREYALRTCFQNYDFSKITEQEDSNGYIAQKLLHP